MTRWAAGVEYAGSAYAGWQSQRGLCCVQSTLEVALSKIAAQPLQVSAAGRTDAGVHAAGQVIHFDTEADRGANAWLLGANSNLPADVSLRWVQPVAEDFHARHSAVARRYRYVIHNERARSALLTDRAAWVTPRLDAGRMHQAAQSLLGERDFSAFRAAECQANTPMRCVLEAEVCRRGVFVVLDIRANAFLHHMVRNIMGTLIEIGQGRRPVEWVTQLLEGRDRRLAAATAPACGLYFVGPEYPSHFDVPAPARPWFPE